MGEVIELKPKRPEGRCWCGWLLPVETKRKTVGLREHLAAKAAVWFEIACPVCGEEYEVHFD